MKSSLEYKKMNWNYLIKFLEPKGFLISDSEINDIIHLRPETALNVLTRLFSFLSGKKNNFYFERKTKKDVPHYMLNTFSFKVNQNYIWGKTNYNERKMYLMKNLEKHKLEMGQEKERLDLKQFIKTKNLERNEIRKSQMESDNNLKKKKTDTQTELVVLKNNLNEKKNQKDLTMVK